MSTASVTPGGPQGAMRQDAQGLTVLDFEGFSQEFRDSLVRFQRAAHSIPDSPMTVHMFISAVQSLMRDQRMFAHEVHAFREEQKQASASKKTLQQGQKEVSASLLQPQKMATVASSDSVLALHQDLRQFHSDFKEKDFAGTIGRLGDNLASMAKIEATRSSLEFQSLKELNERYLKESTGKDLEIQSLKAQLHEVLASNASLKDRNIVQSAEIAQQKLEIAVQSVEISHLRKSAESQVTAFTDSITRFGRQLQELVERRAAPVSLSSTDAETRSFQQTLQSDMRGLQDSIEVFRSDLLERETPGKPAKRRRFRPDSPRPNDHEFGNRDAEVDELSTRVNSMSTMPGSLDRGFTTSSGTSTGFASGVAAQFRSDFPATRLGSAASLRSHEDVSGPIRFGSGFDSDVFGGSPSLRPTRRLDSSFDSDVFVDSPSLARPTRRVRADQPHKEPISRPRKTQAEKVLGVTPADVVPRILVFKEFSDPLPSTSLNHGVRALLIEQVQKILAKDERSFVKKMKGGRCCAFQRVASLSTSFASDENAACDTCVSAGRVCLQQESVGSQVITTLMPLPSNQRIGLSMDDVGFWRVST